MPNKLNKALFLTLLLSFLKSVRAASPQAFNFVFDNNYYSLDIVTDYSEYGSLAREAFANITEAIAQGKCGEVTETDLVPSKSDTLWRDPRFCYSNLEFTKSVSSLGDALFQNCVVNQTIVPEIAPYQDQCDQLDAKEGRDVGIILGSTFGVAFLLVSIAFLIIYCGPSCNRQSKYTPIADPEDKVDVENITDSSLDINSDGKYQAINEEVYQKPSSFMGS